MFIEKIVHYELCILIFINSPIKNNKFF